MKNHNFYYTTIADGRLQYKCLYNDETQIRTLSKLDIKQTKNYKMNCYYDESDEDLFKFREDLLRYNDEIKSVFFKNKDKKIFKIDIFNYNTITDTVINNILVNTNQDILKTIPSIDFREFCVFQNCLSCGLMTIDKTILNQPIKCYGYDYSKFYYNIMKKIRIPIDRPEYTVINSIDFNKLVFGIYRVKIECTNKHFWNIFNFNSSHHYNHNTLKTLYKYKDTYNIQFKLLPPDSKYNYNCVVYNKTADLKTLFYYWFKAMDILLNKNFKGNWLVKTYLSSAWGSLCKYNKIFVTEDDIESYDFDHLENIDYNNPYEHYNYKMDNGRYVLIDSNNAFKYGLARMKPFLTEYCRNYIFNFISEYELYENVIRIQTDGIVFKKKYNFQNIDYAPISEAKSTGLIKFYNLNSYFHICKVCKAEYKFGCKCCDCSK